MPSSPTVHWSTYDVYEGPVVWGSVPYTPPSAPTWPERMLAVVSATEGRCDAVNLYDRAICSAGICQWAENGGGLAVSALLGAIHAKAPGLLAPLAPAMAQASVTFGPRRDGRYRFQFGSVPVETADQMRALYLGGATGKHGEWTDAQRAVATLWAASLSQTLAQPRAIEAQIAFSLSRLETYIFPAARRILWDGVAPDNTGLPGAVRAAYLSFALNLPAVAASQIATFASPSPKWSEGWARDVLRALTYGPNIAIYPGRYNRIRPVLDALFGVSLPATAKDLLVT